MTGRQPDKHDWFYLESVRQSDRSVYIVWACSEACRDALWQRGPGPANIDEAASLRAIERATRRAANIIEPETTPWGIGDRSEIGGGK